MNMPTKLSCAAIWTAVLGLAAWRGASVTFHDQWPLYEALRNTAAIIFAVVGAWLAIVYPERLKLSLRDGGALSAQDAHKNGSKVARLLLPIVHSTVILAVILCVGLIAPLIRSFEFVREHVGTFRAVSYVLLSSLTLLQIWTVILTLVPASEMRNQVLSEAARKGTFDAIFSRARRTKKTLGK